MSENEDLGHELHLTSGIDIEAVGLRGVAYEGTKSSTLFENGVVVMALHGPIYPRSNMMTHYSGAVSLQTLMVDFTRAFNDPDVKGIVLDIDSPGGDVRGLGDAASYIFALSNSRRKPVKTFASGWLASAAYYLGATSQEIIGSKSSVSGSIGVVLSGRKKGDNEYEIVSSQSPYKRSDPATKEGRETIQVMLDDMAELFIEDVAKFRGIDEDTVLSDYGQGKTFVGPRAKRQGLIDGIGTLSSVVESVAKEALSKSYRQPKKSGTKKRKTSAELDELLSLNSEEFMNLKELLGSFRASAESIEGLESENEETVTTVVEGTEEEQPQMSRDELEALHADAATLFAHQMVTGNRILPFQMSHAGSALVNARIDDALIGGTINYADAEGNLVEGTREEAVRAMFAAMPKHGMDLSNIAGVKGKAATTVKILNEEEEAQADSKDEVTSEERRNELLSMTAQGQSVLNSNK